MIVVLGESGVCSGQNLRTKKYFCSLKKVFDLQKIFLHNGFWKMGFRTIGPVGGRLHNAYTVKCLGYPYQKYNTPFISNTV